MPLCSLTAPILFLQLGFLNYKNIELVRSKKDLIAKALHKLLVEVRINCFLHVDILEWVPIFPHNNDSKIWFIGIMLQDDEFRGYLFSNPRALKFRTHRWTEILKQILGPPQ